jgi:hypothetical protein
MQARDGFRKGLSNFAKLDRAERNWVTTQVFAALSLLERGALDRFIESMTAARDALRNGVLVFLSHSSRDKRFVRSLAGYLEENGITVWLDEADLRAGEPLAEQLAGGVQNARLMVVVLSRNSVRSKWVQKELSLAVNQELEGGEVRVIPIMIDRCTVPPLIADKLRLDFTTPKTRERNKPVLVDTLVHFAARDRGRSRRRSPRLP